MVQLAMRRLDFAGLPARPESVEVVALGPSDAAELATVLALSFTDSTWDAAKATQVLLDSPDVDAVYGIRVDGRVVATASAQVRDRSQPVGTVHYVGTHPDATGRGYGTWVTLRVLEHFRDAGMAEVNLSTDDHRLAAIRTYQKLGFEPWMTDPSHPERWRAVLATLRR
ncbi:MAG: GNAT family N-acetyltransferase [Fimbriimonadaceae bacterium]|nr:GNAT family N-acetyltransferase [Fimbriimonadaceae bacterium]